MDERFTTMIVVFLLFVLSGKPAEGQSLLDVCSTCHANATCDDKSDGSGKVCNCKYGFVGNGRTFCQDKDECQIGSNKICGLHTTCHNTYGSYYCTCLAGYSPSNNMAVFIPNDGTHCQDIDECRISGQCGEGAQCRNLDGSFDCSCQVGYKIHNGVEPFHPLTDKASCKVVDCGPPALVEDVMVVSATGTTYGNVATFVCVEGFVWRKGDNRSVCGAEGLWSKTNMVCEEVDCGSPPAFPHSHLLWNKSTKMGTKVVYQCNSAYHNVGKGNVSICTAAGHWARPSVLCQEILCGSPPVIEFTEQAWSNNSTPGSTVLYFCKEGFHNNGGNNVSICQENGQWTPPTLSCQEILCGDPLNLPHTGQVWNGSTTPGSAVIYYCKKGFYYNEGNNVSLCTINGYWTKPDISCKEIDCGEPQLIPNSIMLWDKISTLGSKVIYRCKPGYVSVGTGNISVCTTRGQWDGAPLICQEVDCGEPQLIPNSIMLWDKISTVGSKVIYQCKPGYVSVGTGNVSVCTIRGKWNGAPLICKEINCGEPVLKPHAKMLWDGMSLIGSMVRYQCEEEYYTRSLRNYSVCGENGLWEDIDLWCEAKCGPVPYLANSEVVWHNVSVVIHRCIPGYHSWRGSNISVCASSGVWQKATLICIEIKPPIHHLLIFNESCLQWKAEKYEEDTEVYKVAYTGSRDYQRYFYDKRKRFMTSKADRLELCLSLLPVTNYSITVTATSARFTATITINTSLPVPPGPGVYYREFDTPLPGLSLRRSPNTLDPISFYQVFVLPGEGIMMFNCSSPANVTHPSEVNSPAEYVTAQFDLHYVGTEMNLTIGDGLLYGGFYNAPLESGKNYYIILRAISQWKTAIKSSCVLWAKVRATSYALRVSSLSAVATIGVFAVVIWGRYSITWYGRWCFKKI